MIVMLTHVHVTVAPAPSGPGHMHITIGSRVRELNFMSDSVWLKLIYSAPSPCHVHGRRGCWSCFFT
jgi:hypothetical protein